MGPIFNREEYQMKQMMLFQQVKPVFPWCGKFRAFVKGYEEAGYSIEEARRKAASIVRLAVDNHLIAS